MVERGRNERKVRRKPKRTALIYTMCSTKKEREKREMSLKRCVLFWGEIESGGTVRDTSLRTGGT